ncbi:NAD-dependent epimerase/dehydratase family protein [Kibdelosporangium persicum]|uniref:Nucleoside-diphosphate-sugar epimerase n=1 Tax=Kibdelosporangium persicum TaxID=2698649 RepID=A0ABX2EVW7_9PSEU|nr:NAD-dependent epimerase/dehydratase family protein [Kibdelosporangium persicum]NRN63093.1 Nucleoside-diphosphate-sugar epimerase [Kibdelosporangium persicum]
MRAVVIGATGNIGTSLVRRLTEDPEVTSVLGVARRAPEETPPGTSWASADIRTDDLVSLFKDADVVIHLGWLFQPTHSPVVTWENNVKGSIRVFEAVAQAGVPALVYSSSVGAYSSADKKTPVDETWPTHGYPKAAYPVEKAYVERVLDTFEANNPSVRVVRMRPGFIFKRSAAGHQRRLFAGPFLPNVPLRPGIVPDLPGLRFQALHTEDAADAFHRAAMRDVSGAFNIAADPVVGPDLLADLMDARVVKIPAWPVKAAVAAAWKLHLLPATPGLFETVLRVPIMDTTRARTELGWRAQRTAKEAISELLEGIEHRAGEDTPPLQADVPGGRAKEVATGVGTKD